MINILSAITENQIEIENRLTDSLSRSGSKAMQGDLDMGGFNIVNCPSIAGGSSVISVKDFGAVGDGSTDDAAAINAAIDSVASSGGGTIYFPTGTYILGSAVILKSYVILEGNGFARTILQGKAATSHSLILTENYASLVGSNTAAGPLNFGLRNMSIDGNKANRTGSGFCLGIYGYDYELTNLEIYRSRGIGLYSEWCTIGNVPVTAFGKDTMEAHITGLRIFQCAASGLVFNGPHDSIFRDIHTYINTGSGAEFGQSAVSTAGGTMIDQLHSYGNGTWGIKISTMVFGGLIESESNIDGGIQINTPGGRVQGGTLLGWGNTGIGVQFNYSGSSVSVVANNNSMDGVDLFANANKLSISSYSNGGAGVVYGNGGYGNVVTGCLAYSNGSAGVYLQGNDNILTGLHLSGNAGGGITVQNGASGLRIDGESRNNTGIQASLGALASPAIIDLILYTAPGQTSWAGTLGNNFIRIATSGADIRPINKVQT